MTQAMFSQISHRIERSRWSSIRRSIHYAEIRVRHRL